MTHPMERRVNTLEQKTAPKIRYIPVVDAAEANAIRADRAALGETDSLYIVVTGVPRDMVGGRRQRDLASDGVD